MHLVAIFFIHKGRVTTTAWVNYCGPVDLYVYMWTGFDSAWEVLTENRARDLRGERQYEYNNHVKASTCNIRWSFFDNLPKCEFFICQRKIQQNDVNTTQSSFNHDHQYFRRKFLNLLLTYYVVTTIFFIFVQNMASWHWPKALLLNIKFQFQTTAHLHQNYHHCQRPIYSYFLVILPKPQNLS